MRRSLSTLLVLATATPAFAASFTTADEIRPILEATRPHWVAVRTVAGRDLLYFTQLESWRCGLTSITFQVNGDPETYTKFMEPCYEGTPAPNAFQQESHQPYVTFPADMIESVAVTITYADGETGTASYTREDIDLR